MRLLVFREKELARVSGFDSCAVGSAGHEGQESDVGVVAERLEEHLGDYGAITVTLYHFTITVRLR